MSDYHKSTVSDCFVQDQQNELDFYIAKTIVHMCLLQARTWISNAICRCLFCIEVVDIGVIVDK